ncbi:MAG: thioredoxin domain-containing protein [Hyphomicrobium sp.]
MNRLGDETSPYLLQHRDNPVHWWAWGPDALAEAKQSGKPILLSVGYAACHWCHVMAHESFEDQATADVMNAMFVNIKVDREERPDIDAIYMQALHELGQQGGWPLTMFLDSDARPFWGGTYFPKTGGYGRPPFVTVLLQIAEVYQNEPDKVRNNAEALMQVLQRRPSNTEGFSISTAVVRQMAARLNAAIDREHGGLTGAPKFPQWNVLWFLWRVGIGFDDQAAKDAVLTTLTHICQGGIYDHLGGGFARYSVDERWLVPHFEKMLYDNALLIDLLTEAWRETGDPLFGARIAETVDWLQREMMAEGGAFAASLDADSEGEEGKFYVWSAAEIDDVLGADDAAFFADVYDVTPGGNFEGHTILNRLQALDLKSADDERRLLDLRDKLLARRGDRIRPGFDDKVLADWNGLMIDALARAGVVFQRPAWVAMARTAFDAVQRQMTADGGRLWHSFRAGKAQAPATANDYANMTWAALRLHQATGAAHYLDAAKTWTNVLDRHYWDAESGGYCTAADDTRDVVARLRTAHDDAVPSANTIQLANLIRLGALDIEGSFSARAMQLFAAFQADIARAPIGHCGLIAAGFDLESLMQIVVVADKTARLHDAVLQLSLPGAMEYFLQPDATAGVPVAIASKMAPEATSPKAAAGHAYICVGPVCALPIGSADVLVEHLHTARRLNGSTAAS